MKSSVLYLLHCYLYFKSNGGEWKSLTTRFSNQDFFYTPHWGSFTNQGEGVKKSHFWEPCGLWMTPCLLGLRINFDIMVSKTAKNVNFEKSGIFSPIFSSPHKIINAALFKIDIFFNFWNHDLKVDPINLKFLTLMKNMLEYVFHYKNFFSKTHCRSGASS